ncbi:MAG: hypothetical protein Q8P35_01950 [Candidatus Yanofskybacteria bacterium]|nr:hypothetical protein [Candidatus Yanofskybacteria bacterium]
MKRVFRFRVVDKGTFKDIKSGAKSIETRAGSLRYKNIKAGDTAVFVCGKDKFEKPIKKVKSFKTLDRLFSHYGIRKIMPGLTIREAFKMYESYPGYRLKLKKFGIIAFELR